MPVGTLLGACRHKYAKSAVSTHALWQLNYVSSLAMVLSVFV